MQVSGGPLPPRAGPRRTFILFPQRGREGKSSPVARTISSVHNGFDRCEHSIFFFQQGHWLKRNLLYKFPARYGVGHFHMGLILHNACDKIKI